MTIKKKESYGRLHNDTPACPELNELGLLLLYRKYEKIRVNYMLKQDKLVQPNNFNIARNTQIMYM